MPCILESVNKAIRISTLQNPTSIESMYIKIGRTLPRELPISNCRVREMFYWVSAPRSLPAEG
jgi:hypothetical protein